MAMLSHIDAPLISAFVERWQPDTNSFHLPFGEMTIMLHNVWYILRIPIEGHLVYDQSSIDALKGHAAELFGMPFGDLTGGPDGGESHWAAGGVAITSIDYFYRRRQPTRPRDIVEALEPDSIHEFSWGRLDMLQVSEVDWMPYRTDPSKDVPRTLMVVPMDILAPELAMETWYTCKQIHVKHSSAFADWAWRNFPYSTVLHLQNYDVAMDPGKSAPDYLLWYTHHSHPRLLRDSQTSSHHGGPDRSDTEQWVGLFVHAYEPLLRDREMMPSAASRQACDEVERLISMWNRTLGRQQESQHDSDGSETQ
ncbi:Protein MAINTENANCE OF MERISTEMS [Bienertia sinuspersici]